MARTRQTGTSYCSSRTPSLALTLPLPLPLLPLPPPPPLLPLL
jgi:hypothetical protein